MAFKANMSLKSILAHKDVVLRKIAIGLPLHGRERFDGVGECISASNGRQ